MTDNFRAGVEVLRTSFSSGVYWTTREYDGYRKHAWKRTTEGYPTPFNSHVWWYPDALIQMVRRQMYD